MCVWIVVYLLMLTLAELKGLRMASGVDSTWQGVCVFACVRLMLTPVELKVSEWHLV